MIRIIFALTFISINYSEAKNSSKSKLKPSVKPAAITMGQLLEKVKEDSRGANLKSLNKSSMTVPNAQMLFESQKTIDVNDVKPPKNLDIYTNDNKNKTAYEGALETQITELFKLTQQFKNSTRRGELWLRLAEVNTEKANIISDRIQTEYDAQVKAFNTGKLPVRPVLDTSPVRVYNQKSIQLYEWFLKDFPNDDKTDQALFYLGYEKLEIGEAQACLESYQRLVREFPKSRFATEAHFTIGELLFENEKWAESLSNYNFILQDPQSPLYTTALYKSAWCLFRTSQTEAAIRNLDRLINQETAESGVITKTGKKINTSKLETEAIKDLVVFFADTSDMSRAVDYFKKLESKTNPTEQIEKLAYYLSSKGSVENSSQVFKYLVAQNQIEKKNFDYQYQIIQNYFFSKNVEKFKIELLLWIKNYNEQSSWYKAQKSDSQFLNATTSKREENLRNYILQQHQAAQNTKKEDIQLSVAALYPVYLSEFSNSASNADMHFFYGELLYDLKRYNEAANEYDLIINKYPENKYFEKAAQNIMITRDKLLPTDEDLQKLTRNSVEPLPLDESIQIFIKTADWYLNKFPQAEKAADIRFKIGKLYYLTNNFSQAEKQFKNIIKTYPKTKISEYSTNLLLDIYSLKKDYVGLEKVGDELLADQSIVNTKLESEIRGVLEKASFIQAQNLQKQERYTESAKQYQIFAVQNSKSQLAAEAYYNAALNYEKIELYSDAVLNYQQVLISDKSDTVKIKLDAKKQLAKLYQNIFEYEKSAVLYSELSGDNQIEEELRLKYLYNSALMFEISNQTQPAIDAYSKYRTAVKSKDEKSELLFKISELKRKLSLPMAATLSYIEYIESSVSKPARKAKAIYWVYKLRTSPTISENKIAFKEISKELAVAEGADAAQIKSYLAALSLIQAKELFTKMKSIVMPTQVTMQKVAIDKKLEYMNVLNERLSLIIKYDSAEEIIGALHLLGEINFDMAKTFIDAPLPQNLLPDQFGDYKLEILKIAEPFKNKSIESYKLAVARGRELAVYNSAYQDSLAQLNLQSPVEYYVSKDVDYKKRYLSWVGQ